MVKINIGCAGWDYKDWVASFYPKSLEKYNRLKYYSRFFDLIEINTTFYNLPQYSIVKKWNGRVPENFKFVIKIWQKITHYLKFKRLFNGMTADEAREHFTSGYKDVEGHFIWYSDLDNY